MKDTTFSNNKIETVSLGNMLELLKKAEKAKPSDEKLFKMIATLASVKNLETFKTKMLPKGKVLIGTGEILEEKFIKLNLKTK